MKFKSLKIQEYIETHLKQKYPFDTPHSRTQRVCHVKKAILVLNFLRNSGTQRKFYSEAVYKYAVDNAIAPGYLVHIIDQVNQLIEYFEINAFIRKPKGGYKQKILDAYINGGKKSGCDPLTPALLEEIKPKLRETSYNFFYCTFWLGLRPSELLQTKRGIISPSTKFSFKTKFISGTKVLLIYQNKLHQLKEEDRWKYIPILEPQQKIALDLLESGNFTRPSNLLLQTKPLTDTPNVRIRGYSGRKGFVPMMLGKGYKLEDLSSMLGHRNVAMSLKYYTDHISVQEARIKEMVKQ